MAIRHTKKPKGGTPKWAWEIFTRDLKAEPVDMEYGKAEHYGMIYCATDQQGNIWGLSAVWAYSKVLYQTGKPVLHCAP